MTDLRKAAEMAFAKLEHLWEIGIDAEYKVELLPEIEALRQALAQPEQEPFKPDWVSYRQGVADGAAQPEQEPKLSDAGVDTSIPLWGLEPKGSGMVALHQREWVGLTDEEIKGILDCGRGGLVDIKKAEQILKEKNDAV